MSIINVARNVANNITEVNQLFLSFNFNKFLIPGFFNPDIILLL